MFWQGINRKRLSPSSAASSADGIYDALVAVWDMQEATGPWYLDWHQGLNLAVSTTTKETTLSRERLPTAVRYNSTTDRPMSIRTIPASIQGAVDMSVWAWFRIDSLAGGNADNHHIVMIAEAGETEATNAQFNFWVNADGELNYQWEYGAGLYEGDGPIPGVTIVADRDYFIVASRDSVAKVMTFYVFDATMGTMVVATDSYTNNPSGGSSAVVIVGNATTGFNRNFNGWISGVGIAGSTLTPENVVWLYNEGRGRTYDDIYATQYPERAADSAGIFSSLYGAWDMQETTGASLYELHTLRWGGKVNKNGLKLGATTLSRTNLPKSVEVINHDPLVMTHFAVEKQGRTFRLYVDGYLRETLTLERDINGGTTGHFIIGGYRTSVTSDLAFDGRIDNFCYTKAVRYGGSNFTPDTTTRTSGNDPHWSNVKFYLRMEGANGGTTFTDDTGNTTWTAFNGATTSTSSPLIGSSSALFDGTNDQIRTPYSADLDMADDWTVDGWFKADDLGAQAAIFSAFQEDSVHSGYTLTVETNGNLRMHIGQDFWPSTPDYIEAYDAATPSTTTTLPAPLRGAVDMSVWGWFRLNSRDQLRRVFSLGGDGETEATNIQLAMLIQANNTFSIHWEYGAGTNFDQQFDPSIFSLVEDVDYFFTITRDATAKILRVYINGYFKGEINYANNPTGGTSATVNFGHLPGSFANFDGYLSGFGIATSELSHGNVTWLCNDGDGRNYMDMYYDANPTHHSSYADPKAIWQALISWWEFDETNGIRYDRHTGHHFPQVGFIEGTTGKFVNGLPIASSANHLEIDATTSSHQLAFGDVPFTVVSWVKRTATGVANQVVIGRYASTTRSWFLGVESAGQTAFAAALTNTTHTTANYPGETVSRVDGSTWIMTAGYHDPTANTIAASLDGLHWFAEAHSGGVYNANTVDIRVGIDAADTNIFSGVIDQTAVFNRVLTRAEKDWLWNYGEGRTYDQLRNAFAESYVVIAGGGARVWVSDGNLAVWTHRTIAGMSGNVTGMGYGCGLYFIGTSDGEIFTSPDTITWTERTSPTTDEIADFCSLDEHNVVVTSTRPGGLGDGKVLRSTDGGITWTQLSTPTGSGHGEISQIINSPLGLISCCETNNFGGYVIMSTDLGATWTRYTSNVVGFGTLWVPYPGYFLICGNNGEVAVSTSGTTWTNLGNFFPGDESFFFPVWYPTTGKIYVKANAATPKIRVSADGRDWPNANITSSHLVGLRVAGKLFIAMGANWECWYTLDGTNWINQDVTAGSGLNISAVFARVKP